MQKTKIEYLTHTWNPIAMRCTPIWEGCKNCWHLAYAKRMAANPKIDPERREAYAGGNPVLIEKELEAPLRLRNPSIIGVQFMGDLYHPGVPTDFITMVYEVMAMSQQHQFIVCTKRPERLVPVLYEEKGRWFLGGGNWIWQNIMHLTTAENQEMLDVRVPGLLKFKDAGCNAWEIGVSLEPLLGRINMDRYLPGVADETGHCRRCGYEVVPEITHECPAGFGASIDWVIVGGETGTGFRPMEADWARSIRDQCREAGVPFFMKQMSGKAPIPEDLMICQYPFERKP